MMNWKLCGRKRSRSISRHYPSICNEGTAKDQDKPQPTDTNLSEAKMYATALQWSDTVREIKYDIHEKYSTD
jgi:hypothetical protein